MNRINVFEGTMLTVTLLCAKLYISYPLLGKNFSGFQILMINFLSFAVLWGILNFSLREKAFSNTKVRNTLLIILLFITITFLSFSFCAYVRSLKFSLLYNSPEGFISFIMIPGIVFGAFSGIKSLSKMCGFFTPAILVLTVIFMLFSCKALDVSGMFPVLGSGIGDILRYLFVLLSSLWEGVFIMFLPDFTKNKKVAKKILFYSVLISFAFFTFMGIMFNLNGIKKATEYSEIFKTIRLINPVSSMERPDAVFYIMYVLFMLLYMSVCIFFAKHIFKSVFDITYPEVLVIPLCLIVSLFAVTGFDSGFSLFIYKSILSFLWAALLICPFLQRRNKS